MTDIDDVSEQESPRTTARRRQVVDAAAACFRRYGFHSASMAQVAHEAGMSVGHIYRYFSGKEAIIAAIVRQQHELVLSRFPAEAARSPNIEAFLRRGAHEAVRQAFDLDWSTLMIEVRAEAGRNTAVAEIVRAADAEVADRVRGVVIAGFAPGKVPDDIERRMEMVALVIEGITFRGVSHPTMDPGAAHALVDLVIDNIFVTTIQR